jgi:hypothetical protein
MSAGWARSTGRPRNRESKNLFKMRTIIAKQNTKEYEEYEEHEEHQSSSDGLE